MQWMYRWPRTTGNIGKELNTSPRSRVARTDISWYWPSQCSTLVLTSQTQRSQVSSKNPFRTSLLRHRFMNLHLVEQTWEHTRMWTRRFCSAVMCSFRFSSCDIKEQKIITKLIHRTSSTMTKPPTSKHYKRWSKNYRHLHHEVVYSSLIHMHKTVILENSINNWIPQIMQKPSSYDGKFRKFGVFNNLTCCKKIMKNFQDYSIQNKHEQTPVDTTQIGKPTSSNYTPCQQFVQRFCPLSQEYHLVTSHSVAVAVQAAQDNRMNTKQQ